MADEIVATIGLSATKGFLSVAEETISTAITMNGTRAAAICQDIGTTFEAIVNTTDYGTIGVVKWTNLDPTNYVEIGVSVASAFYPVLRLNPGESWLVRMAQGVTFYAKANTGAVKLRGVMLED